MKRQNKYGEVDPDLDAYKARIAELRPPPAAVVAHAVEESYDGWFRYDGGNGTFYYAKDGVSQWEVPEAWQAHVHHTMG